MEVHKLKFGGHIGLEWTTMNQLPNRDETSLGTSKYIALIQTAEVNFDCISNAQCGMGRYISTVEKP